MRSIPKQLDAKQLKRKGESSRWPIMHANNLAHPTTDRTHRERRVVAVGLLTERDLSVLGQGFKRAYRLDDNHDFHDLLARIDLAEQKTASSAD